MTHWRDAQPDGIHSCSHRCTRPECMDARAAEIESLRADAARYRWLRDNAGPWHAWSVQRLGVKDMDAAIDAAMDFRMIKNG